MAHDPERLNNARVRGFVLVGAAAATLGVLGSVGGCGSSDRSAPSDNAHRPESESARVERTFRGHVPGTRSAKCSKTARRAYDCVFQAKGGAPVHCPVKVKANGQPMWRCLFYEVGPVYPTRSAAPAPPRAQRPR
jgi:hypothetical protein